MATAAEVVVVAAAGAVTRPAATVHKKTGDPLPRAGRFFFVARNDQRQCLDLFVTDPKRHLECRRAPLPRVKPGRRGWANSEAKELHALLNHLVKELPIGAGRVHAVGVKDLLGFFPRVAFLKRKKFRFVSATFADSEHRGGSPPAYAKKGMGVLVFGTDPLVHNDKTAEVLRGAVRVLEHRSGAADLEGAYFRYWLGVMEDRFEPGLDLSFPWIEDEKELRDRLAKENRGAFVYFYAKDDKDKLEGRALQNEIFLHEKVRSYGSKLTAAKFDREKHGALFDSFHLKQTPAIVVLKDASTVVKRFEGRIKTSALAKAMRAAARGG